METTTAKTATGNGVATVDSEQFRGTTFFSLTPHTIGNRVKVKDNSAYLQYLAQLADEISKREASEQGKADTSRAAADLINGKGTDKSKLAARATKQLLVSQPLEDLNSFLAEVKARFVGRFGKAQQSKIMKGLYILRDCYIDEVEDDVRAANTKIATELFPAFVNDYQDAIERTRTLPLLDGGLGPLFDPSDYPAEAAKFSGAVRISRFWVKLGVAENLPRALREQCLKEYQAKCQDAAEECKDALRAGLGGFLDNLVERLEVKPGSKPPIFKDTLIENIRSFCAVFDAKNFVNDTDLAAQVAACKKLLEDPSLTPENCRKYASVRENTRAQFVKIQEAVNGMLAERKSRAIDLSDD